MTSRAVSRNSTSGIVGVSWNTRQGKWLATVKHNGHQHYCGSYHSRKEAALAVQRKRDELGVGGVR